MIMGFYGPVPFNNAEVTYVWTGLGEPGFFSVKVSGQAQKYTYGIQLVRDESYVGGIAIRVMGWTGPVGQGTSPYTVTHAFPGMYVPKVLIIGANKRELVDVKQIPQEQSEDFIRANAA
jgi:hypothetical protein